MYSPHTPRILAMVIGLLAMVVPASTTLPAQAAADCTLQSANQLPNVAFCDTFDGPTGTGNRSGDLNGAVWGVSRIIGGVQGDHYASGTDIGQGLADTFAPVTLAGCGNPTVLPDQDVQVCNGQLVEGVNDDGGQSVLAMYPKQPFDIAGRTGTVVFDVSADSEGPHAAWPAFAYTDQPVPAPYGSTGDGPFTTMEPYARNGFGFSLDALPADCTTVPNCHGTTKTGVDDVYAVSNYAMRVLTFTPIDNVLTHQAGLLNHIKVLISAARVEIWGTNAGSTTYQELGYVANPALTLTRGLIWLEDVHYNADKFNDQQSHTFTWDNVGFDGPVLPRDLTFDVPENGTITGGAEQLGWGNAALTIPNVTNTAQATGALLTMNWWPETADTVTIAVNGNAAVTQPWVFNGETYVWRTIAIPVPLAEVHDGANTVSISTSDSAAIANVDLILQGAGGVVGAPVGTDTAVPSSPTATASPTLVPATSTQVSATATSTATPALPTATSTQAPPSATTTTTPVPPTGTGTMVAILATSTSTPLVPVPTDTPIASGTATATPIPATNTVTPTTSPVAADVNSIPPSSTSTVTPAPMPPTIVPTPSNVAIPPAPTNSSSFLTSLQPAFTATAGSTPLPSASATMTATLTPAPTNTAVPPTIPIATGTSRPTNTPMAPTLVIHNQARTVAGGRKATCALVSNTNGAHEAGCEIVSSVSGPDATVTYTLTYPNHGTQTFKDTADSRGHSLHPFNAAYLPAAGRQPVTISVSAVLADGTDLGPVTTRFAVMNSAK